VTRDDALKAMQHFIKHALPKFGPYQDAMQEGDYLLFHSGLSPYLNCGLLHPREVCKAAEQAYRKGKVPLQSAEGFIRQILGWREFVRGIYWLHMPKYAKKNHLKAKRPLPSLYWGGDTKMNCLKQVVKQTEETAGSHHIQRLMVTGNFALLAGLDPTEVCEWYLAVYADAYEWVELPNTLGMALYGDGGVVGTKPYGSSGAYIKRMSNFCANCAYDVKEKTGDNACPFNYLYWDFFLRHQKLLQDNPRLAFPYRHIGKMKDDQKKAIRQSAKRFLDDLD
jgi:deoxyribodipyrimidine photolyase-related protein